MPELPEVETVRRHLDHELAGITILKAEARWPKLIKTPEAEEFLERVQNQTIHKVERRGKFLRFILDDYVVVSHLRMEGKYRIIDENSKDVAREDKHTHVVFELEDGRELHYNDVRKFGTFHLYPTGADLASEPLVKLGPEPFDPMLTSESLKGQFGRTSRNIKAVLLDQTFVTGLGNIYVDEALFLSGIHPETRARDLSSAQLEKLLESIREVLQAAIDKGGSSVRTYISASGSAGEFQLSLNVYGREGEPCRVCGQEIVKSKVAGRGTHICPACQEEERHD